MGPTDRFGKDGLPLFECTLGKGLRRSQDVPSSLKSFPRIHRISLIGFPADLN